MQRVVFAVLTLVLAIAPAQAITVTVTPSQTVEVGDSFDVDLIISELGDFAAPSLGGFDITMGYLPPSIAPTAVTFGTVFASGGAAFQCDSISDPATCPANPPVGPAAFLRFIDTSLDPLLDSNQPGSFLLATVTFQALSVGTSQIGASAAILLDSAGQRVIVTRSVGALIDVTEKTVIPEPSTVVLMLGGVLALGVRRWRRK